jgi:hypothetical protein
VLERLVEPDRRCPCHRAREEQSSDEQRGGAFAAAEIAERKVDVSVMEAELPVGTEAEPLAAEHELPAATDLVCERLDSFGQVPIRDSIQGLLGDLDPRGPHGLPPRARTGPPQPGGDPPRSRRAASS